MPSPVVRFVILTFFSENCPINSATLFLELYLQKKLINIINQDITIYYRSTSVFNHFLYFFRFLSTGISSRSLSFSARIAHNTIAEIVYDTHVMPLGTDS